MPHDHHGHSHDHHHEGSDDPRYRKALWIALALNAAMFVVEVGAGFRADSASLLADAIDFAGDAVNYGLALWALTVATVWRSRTALLKGVSMLVFGIAVIAKALWLLLSGTVPVAETMGVIGLLALAVNVGVAVMLYAWREGDANMQSVWLCTRNDAIGNVAVIAAAGLVWVTDTGYADVAVAVFMGGLAIHSGARVVRLAKRELLQAARQENLV